MNKIDKRVTKINYTLFTIIFVFTLISSIVVYMLYDSYKDNKENESAIKQMVNTISLKNMTEYLNENKVVYLYLNDSSSEIRKYEDDMIKMAKEYNVSITFLDMSLVKDKKAFIKKINSKYSNDINLKRYPAFILIEDNLILKIVEEKDNKLNSKNMLELFKYIDKEV